MTFPARLFAPLAACALALPAARANAQIELTALSLTAQAYSSLENWTERGTRPYGLAEIVAVDGHMLVNVRLVADGPWSDEVDRVRANSRDIRLVLPDGSELEPRGGFQYWGQFSRVPPGLSGRRPRDFPDEDRDIHWNGMFVVPTGVSSATLRIGGDDVSFEGPVSIGKTTTPEAAASFAEFRVTSQRRFRAVDLEDGRGADALTSRITAPEGMALVELEVEIRGTGSNQADGDPRFNWHTTGFRLVDADGNSMGLIGERFMRRILDSQFNGVNIGDDTERTMVFVAPDDVTAFQLYFGNVAVADVDVTGSQIADTD